MPVAHEQSKDSSQAAVVKEEPPLDGPSIRRLILDGMARASAPTQPIIPHRERSCGQRPRAHVSQCIHLYRCLMMPILTTSSLLTHHSYHRQSQPGPYLAQDTLGATRPKRDEYADLF